MEVIVESPGGRRSSVTLAGPVGPPGSQGEVRAISGVTAAVAKLVRNPAALRLEERLDVMFATAEPALIMRGPLVRVSWPAGRVRRVTDDTVIGYLQPRLGPPKFLPMRDVFHDAVRIRALPGATWRWYVTLAADLAATVAMVAERGHTIGDLAPENLFVTAGAHVAFVDVDGWQLAARDGREPLTCPFSRPEYTAPECLNSDARTAREAPSDWWALAVLIGQILFLGCHPFAGIAPGTEPPYEETANVRSRRCWLTGGQVDLPPGTPSPVLLPARLRTMLADCFGDGYDDPSRRPGAGAWAAALGEVTADLTQCGITETHVYPGALRTCPWCELTASGTPDRFPRVAGVTDDSRCSHVSG